MRMKYTYSNFIQLIISVVLYLIICIFTALNWDNYTTYIWYDVIGLLSIISLTIQLLLLISRHKSVLVFESIFVFLYHVFAFGRIYLLCLGKTEYIFWDLLLYYSDLEKWRAGLLALCIIQGIVTGFLLYSEQKNNLMLKETDTSFDFYGLTPRHMFICGLIFFVITEPITLYVAFKNIVATSIAGRYADADINGVIGCLSYVSPVGIILMVASKYLNPRRIFRILIVFNVLSIILATFTGDRRYVVTGVLVTFLTYIYVYRIRIKPLKVIVYMLLAIILLAIINSIRIVRSSSAVSFSSIVDYLRLSSNSPLDVICESLAEFGITFFTYLEVVHYYPAVFPYKLGVTYLLGPITLIPGIGQLFPEISRIVSVPAPIEEVLDYSVGGSFGEELFGNFGYVGIFLAIVVGFFIARFMRNKMTNRASGYQVAKYYIAFYFFVNLVRATFNEMLRSIVWTFVLIFVIRIFYVNVFVKDKKS